MFGTKFKIFKSVFCLIFIGSSYSQLFLDIIPGWKQSAREIANELTKFEPLQNIAKHSGDVLAELGGSVASFPIAIARSFGPGIKFPSLINNINVVGLTDDFIADFQVGKDNEDTKLNIQELLQKYGFPVQKHRVVTADKYVLSMFRIPGDGPPVYLQHGLLGSADDYVVNGPDNGLAYLLAREGYDVWLGNARGNKHSRRHLILSPKDAEFWDFSWHEIGCRDLPAMIDYVLQKTGRQQLSYIGHSQGTTAFFVMASERPEYNKKIKAMIALSAVAFMEHTKSPIIRLLAPGTDIIHGVMQTIGLHEFFSDNIVMRTIKMLVCGHGPVAEIICNNAVFMVCGFSLGQTNATVLPVELSHMPSGAATKQIAHYGQGVLSKDFRQFDYGLRGNLDAYGSEYPPSYELHRITCPVHIFRSDEDWLAQADDVDKLASRMANVKEVYHVEYEPFNHLDFLLARDFKHLIYKKIRKILKNAYK